MRNLYAWPLFLVLISTAQADPGRAEMIYMSSCIACHGSDGSGVMPGVRDLSDPNGALMKEDKELFKAIRDGVRAADGGIAMPPNGGNPNLTEADIRSLISYLRVAFIPKGDTDASNIGEKK